MLGASERVGNLIGPDRIQEASERRAYLSDRRRSLIDDDVHSERVRETVWLVLAECRRTDAERSEAERMVSLEDAKIDPDDDDIAASDMFPIPTGETRAVAREMAVSLMIAMWRFGRVPAPQFEAAGNGGVGLHWESERAELLIVVPPDRSARVPFLMQVPGHALVKGWITHNDISPIHVEWFVSRELSAGKGSR